MLFGLGFLLSSVAPSALAAPDPPVFRAVSLPVADSSTASANTAGIAVDREAGHGAANRSEASHSEVGLGKADRSEVRHSEVRHSKAGNGAASDIAGGAEGLDELASRNAWRRLLHADVGVDDAAATTAVVNDGFHLVPLARFTPRAELAATLEAFSEAIRSPAATGDTGTQASRVIDADPRCLYPARFQWLASVLPETVGRWPRMSCPSFDAWIDLDSVAGLSVLQVSGFFGNPASAFGHLLLRVDSRNATGERGLLDLGINFGADVPVDENFLRYTLTGLLGGYQAGFSEQSFHLHDAVYSSLEQRDMWAYRLDLDRGRRDLILRHLWELTRARFDYYFLKYNCAWYLSGLLELALDTRIRPERTLWHLPQSVFESLDTLQSPTGGPLVESVTFLPSLQHEAVDAFQALSPEEARIANTLVSTGLPANDLAEAPVAVLDFLLDWTDLRFAAARGDTAEMWSERKQRVFGERLLRPTDPEANQASFAVPPPPAGGPSALTVGMGAITADDGMTIEPTLRLAPYAYDLLNRNRGGLVDAAFKVLDGSVTLADDTVKLRSLDILAVEKLAPPDAAIVDTSRFVWRGALRVTGDDRRCTNCSAVALHAGFGLASRLGTPGAINGIGYVLLDGSIGRDQSQLGPALGLLFRPTRRLALRLESRYLVDSSRDAMLAHSLDVHLSLGRQLGVSIDATRVAEREQLTVEATMRFR